MTAEQYFSAPGVSNTMLGKLNESPAHLQSYLREPQEATKAMELGTDFHDLLLLDIQPQNIAIKPEGLSFATREGKAWRAEQEAAGLRIVEAKSVKAMFGMREAILANRSLRAAIENGEKEVALFAPFTLGGTVMRKGRLDLIPTSRAVIDFKTTTCSDRREFGRTIAERGYHRQGAYYLDLARENGYPQTDFLFVAVEKTPPYSVGLHYLTPEQIEAGRGQYTRLLQIYLACKERDFWPDYDCSTVPVPAEIPEWCLRVPELPGWMKGEAA